MEPARFAPRRSGRPSRFTVLPVAHLLALDLTLCLVGLQLGPAQAAALASLSKTPRPVTAKDFVPDMGQKGVDIRIGLDIARISVKRIVDIIVLITGDSDFVPVMKFARTEGLKVYLEPLGHAVRRELKVHADFVL